jgi:hypothetical protein
LRKQKFLAAENGINLHQQIIGAAFSGDKMWLLHYFKLTGRGDFGQQFGARSP